MAVAAVLASAGIALGQLSAPARPQPFPTIDAYWPDREATVRLRRLISNAMLEAQLNYRIDNGDVSAFLRYKYYASSFAYRVSVFDALEFPNIGDDETVEYERVRGAVLLLTFPRNYNNRYQLMLQGENLTFGDLADIQRNRKNSHFFTRIGYQYGTSFDERLNGIAGETRASVQPLVPTLHEADPQKTGFAVGLSQAITGQYDYTKLEAEVLRRFDIMRRVTLMTRLHVGTFAGYKEDTEILGPEMSRYSVPRDEMYRLGGRDALISLPINEFTQGLHEVHSRSELFVPVARNRDFRTGPLRWYAFDVLGYAAAGAVAFKSGQVLKNNNVVVDGGIGFQTAVAFRDIDTYLTVLFGHTIQAPCVRDPVTDKKVPGARCLEGGVWAVGIRTVK